MKVNSESTFSFENSFKLSFPLLVLLGVVNLTAYYSQFGLPVLNYLSLSEIIPLFLGNIIYFLFIIVPIIFLGGFVNIENSKSLDIIFLCIITISGFLILLNDDGVFDFRISLLTISLAVVYIPFAFVFILEKHFIKVFSTNRIPRYISVMIFYLTSLLATSILAWSNAREVIKYHKFSGTEIIVDGKAFISNDTTYFIGKTDQYVFMYNENDKSPIIIPLSKVDKITFKNKHVNRGGDRPQDLPQIP